MDKYFTKLLIRNGVEKLMLCTYNLELNDEVEIHFTDGEILKGKITQLPLPAEEPYCEIDGEGVDLATEGASSSMFKVLGEVSGN